MNQVAATDILSAKACAEIAPDGDRSCARAARASRARGRFDAVGSESCLPDGPQVPTPAAPSSCPREIAVQPPARARCTSERLASAQALEGWSARSGYCVMPRRPVRLVGAGGAIAAGLTACSGNQATVPIEQGYGPNPTLPPPVASLIPTVNIAPANPWPEGTAPMAAAGFAVNEYAGGLDHPRWLHVLPNGDVLVAETNAPPKPRQAFSLRDWVMGLMMGRAGAEVPSANRITLLRDQDGDGVAEMRSAFLENLNSPFGMALIGDTLYVANTDAIVAFPYQDGATEITAPGEKIVDLPAGPINHHWTKDVIASPDGTQALRDRRVQQQRRRERHGGRGDARRGAGDRPREPNDPGFCLGPAKPQRPRVAARQRRALGRGQRARRDRQRSRPGLHDLGPGWRLLRLALQLLRPARRRCASSRSGRIWWRGRSCPTTRSARTPPRWA